LKISSPGSNRIITYINDNRYEEFVLAEFVKLDNSIKDAILTIIKYLKAETGVEPTQEEVAALLKSYFILNEIGNQIKYQLKNEAQKSGGAEKVEANGPFWKLNLKTGPVRNALARTGIFHHSIKEAIDSMRHYVKKTIGADPSYDIIAKSLKSSFILSEIKNQFDYQRKESQK
jgi:hypothetical protein